MTPGLLATDIHIQILIRQCSNPIIAVDPNWQCSNPIDKNPIGGQGASIHNITIYWGLIRSSIVCGAENVWIFKLSSLNFFSLNFKGNLGNTYFFCMASNWWHKESSVTFGTVCAYVFLCQKITWMRSILEMWTRMANNPWYWKKVLPRLGWMEIIFQVRFLYYCYSNILGTSQ